jgi:hypothetical protein
MPESYSNYLQRLGKDLSRAAVARRSEVFELNSAYVSTRAAHLQEQGYHYSLELNEFADWYPEELTRLFSTGFYLFESAQKNNSSSTLEYADGESSTVTSINWATTDNPKSLSVIPPARNQGRCGACWAFVSAGSAEAAVGIATGNRVALSVQQLIDCNLNFNQGCRGGNPIYAYQYIMQNGLTYWDSYPYQDTQVCNYLASVMT